MSATPSFTVSGPGVDRGGYPSAAVGLSAALTFASRADGEATFYVRDPGGECVGRVERRPDGIIRVLGHDAVRGGGHDAAFAALQERKRAQEEADVGVTWRRLSPVTGGGWLGRGPHGRVYVGARTSLGDYAYGQLIGKHRSVLGVAPTLAQAKASAAAAALVPPDPPLAPPENGHPVDSPVPPNRKKENMPSKSATKSGTSTRSRSASSSTTPKTSSSARSRRAASAPATPPPVEDVTGRAGAPPVVALYDDLLQRVTSLVPSATPTTKKNYIRFSVGKQTVAYLCNPTRKSVRVEVPREGGGYEAVYVSDDAAKAKALAAVEARVKKVTEAATSA